MLSAPPPVLVSFQQIIPIFRGVGVIRAKYYNHIHMCDARATFNTNTHIMCECEISKADAIFNFNIYCNHIAKRYSFRIIKHVTVYVPCALSMSRRSKRQNINMNIIIDTISDAVKH